MKKILSLVLTLMLLGASAAAENLYEKEIQFAEFTFGMTFEQVRSQVWVDSIEFRRNPKPTRLVGDALSEVYSIVYDELSVAAQFSARLQERDVAGHRAQVHMYFTYPDSARNDSQAVFYAGTYMFYENGKSTFEDLKAKLSTIYGTPWMETNDAEAIWGPMPWDGEEGQEWRQNEWNQMKERYQPIQYVVWKSSANGAMLVLKSMRMFGDTDVAEVDYLWPEADKYFDAMMQDSGSGAGSGSLEGL